MVKEHVMETPKADPYRAEVAHIGKSVLVKGELSGSEDLYLDGEVEGTIMLKDHALIIGPNGRIRANVTAKDVTIHGKVDGNVRGSERVELKRSAVLSGDIATQRIVIEDGAFFKGAIDIQKEAAKPELHREKEKTMAAAATYSSSSSSSTAASPPMSAQSSLLDTKKV
jgi:cytoskeletal protein CcmA (bactofilin family)